MLACWALARAGKAGSLEAPVLQAPAITWSASVTPSACNSLGNNKNDLDCHSAAWFKKIKGGGGWGRALLATAERD